MLKIYRVVIKITKKKTQHPRSFWKNNFRMPTCLTTHTHTYSVHMYTRRRRFGRALIVRFAHGNARAIHDAFIVLTLARLTRWIIRGNSIFQCWAQLSGAGLADAFAGMRSRLDKNAERRSRPIDRLSTGRKKRNFVTRAAERARERKRDNSATLLSLVDRHTVFPSLRKHDYAISLRTHLASCVTHTRPCPCVHACVYTRAKHTRGGMVQGRTVPFAMDRSSNLEKCLFQLLTCSYSASWIDRDRKICENFAESDARFEIGGSIFVFDFWRIFMESNDYIPKSLV